MTIENDSMSSEDFALFLTSAFESAEKVMKKGASFYVWYASTESVNFITSANKAGFQIREILVWNKNSMTIGRQDYQHKYEPCLYGWKDGASHNWYSDRKQTTVLDFDRPTKSDLHPTMKPVKLFDYQIKNSSKPNDAILDLFGGSGTTIIACEQNKRNANVMEYDPKYADVIIKRWEDLTGEEAELVE